MFIRREKLATESSRARVRSNSCRCQRNATCPAFARTLGIAKLILILTRKLTLVSGIERRKDLATHTDADLRERRIANSGSVDNQNCRLPGGFDLVISENSISFKTRRNWQAGFEGARQRYEVIPL